MIDDPWTKRVRELGWDFGNDGTALMALRGMLETSQTQYTVGHHTLIDALHEHKERQKAALIRFREAVLNALDEGEVENKQKLTTIEQATSFRTILEALEGLGWTNEDVLLEVINAIDDYDSKWELPMFDR